MMEIKFRAWNKADKCMVEVDSIYFDNKLVGLDDPENKNRVIGKSFEEVKLMQYTGLKDVKGVEIYKGDIVEFARGRHQVGFLDGSFVLYDRNQWHIPFYTVHGGIEVIGNIYENPELI